MYYVDPVYVPSPRPPPSLPLPPFPALLPLKRQPDEMESKITREVQNKTRPGEDRKKRKKTERCSIKSHLRTGNVNSSSHTGFSVDLIIRVRSRIRSFSDHSCPCDKYLEKDTKKRNRRQHRRRSPWGKIRCAHAVVDSRSRSDRRRSRSGSVVLQRDSFNKPRAAEGVMRLF